MPDLIWHACDAYYRLRSVKERIAEFCVGAGEAQTGAKARYLVGYGIASEAGCCSDSKVYFSTHQLDELLRRGLDCSRSIWDEYNTVAVLDVDYQNVDFPGEAFLNPLITYAKLEPVYQAITSELRALGIDYLSTMTGKGYHFVWRIPDDHQVTRRLCRIGHLTSGVTDKYSLPHATAGEPLPLEKGRAFAGLGLLMEYLTHRIIRRATKSSVLPVVTTGLAVGSSITGREAVSIDLAAHGDPLHLRDFRSPFSRYQKHLIQRGLVGNEAVSRMPFVVCLPRGDIPLRDLLRVRTHPQAAAELAQGWSTPFPDGATGTARLLRLYERSALAGFHRQFISSPDSHAEQRRERNEQLDVGAFPRCVAAPLLYANDWLLKPTYLQVLARVLWALGWEPRQIADLVHSRYQDGCGWGNTWMLYDAGTRADFWVRVMTGLVVDGTDDLADFNCVSQAEKGYCPQPFCGHNLALYRDMLLKRLQ